MGWTYMNRAGKTAKEIVTDLYSFEAEKVKSEVLDCAIVKFKTAYLAVRHTNKETGESYVYAGVCLLGYAPNDYFDFGHKGMDETMGPSETECPQRILDLLSPVEQISKHETTQRWANKWRESCRERLRRKEAAPPLKTGSYLILKTPLDYGGEKKSRMLITNAKKRLGDGRYRIPSKERLLRYGYDVVVADAPTSTAAAVQAAARTA